MTKGDGQLPDRVRDLAVPVAETLDVAIVDVQVKGQRGRRLVRVVADVAVPEPGAEVDVDTIAVLSRRLGDRLDEQDLIPGAYTLEVSSPGADRALRSPRDFIRNIGRQVRVLRAESLDGPREVTGIVVEVTDDEVTLEVAGDPVNVALAEVDHGKVVLPW